MLSKKISPWYITCNTIHAYSHYNRSGKKQNIQIYSHSKENEYFITKINLRPPFFLDKKFSQNGTL